MKTLYLTNSSANIWVDTDTDEVGRLYTEDRYQIRDLILFDENMHVVYGDSEEKCEADVKKGDIIIIFYSGEKNPNKFAIVKSKEWRQNIIAKHKLDQEEKERWAKAKAETPTCDNCEDCCKG